MAKKETTVKVVPDVKNSITMAVNQNDIVEMLISEQRENMENELEKQYKELAQFPALNIWEIINAYVQMPSFIDSKTIVAVASYNDNAYSVFKKPDDEEKEVPAPTISIPSSFEELVEKGPYRSTFKQTKVIGIQVSGSDTDKFGMKTKITIEVPVSALPKSVVKELERQINKKYDIALKIRTLYDEWRKLGRSPGIMKSRILRKSLSQSVDGQNVLNLIDQAKVKLLS